MSTQETRVAWVELMNARKPLLNEKSMLWEIDKIIVSLLDEIDEKDVRIKKLTDGINRADEILEELLQ